MFIFYQNFFSSFSLSLSSPLSSLLITINSTLTLTRFIWYHGKLIFHSQNYHYSSFHQGLKSFRGDEQKYQIHFVSIIILHSNANYFWTNWLCISWRKKVINNKLKSRISIIIFMVKVIRGKCIIEFNLEINCSVM